MGQLEIRKRRRLRRRTYIWALSWLAVVSALIYWEHTALLYVLATLAMTVLLIMVAFSDLEGRDRELHKHLESESEPGFGSNPKSTPSSRGSADSSARKREKGAA